MASGIKDKVAILGMGCAKFGERWDKNADDLIVEAFNEALQDAGIETHQIDAAWFGTAIEEQHVGKSGVPLATALRLPYIPVTPWGLALPKPCPVHIAYGEPMIFDGDGTEEDKVVVGYVEEVKARIGQLITDARRARGEEV